MQITYPMDLINSHGWYVTLPSKLRATPDTVKVGGTPDLLTYADEYFRLNDTKDGVVFKAPSDGAHTTNSSNPRSELREMSTDGKTQASWSTTSGIHSMEIEQSVDALPIGSKPVVVVGQIHGSSDDITVFRVEANTYDDNTGDKTLNSIWITKGNTTHGCLVTNSYKLGDKFRNGFIVTGGVISYTFNGVAVAYTYAKKTSGCYFKAGSYNQSGGNVTKLPSGEADYAEVTIYALQVCHDGVCTGNAPGAITDPPVTDGSIQALVDSLNAAMLTFQGSVATSVANLAAALKAAIDKLPKA